jgi:chorismate-pyruvate lyase
MTVRQTLMLFVSFVLVTTGSVITSLNLHAQQVEIKALQDQVMRLETRSWASDDGDECLP